MDMKVTPDVIGGEEPGERVRQSRLDLPAVLPQFRRNEREPQDPVDIFFFRAAEPPVVFIPEDAVLVDLQPLTYRHVPQPNVMVF